MVLLYLFHSSIWISIFCPRVGLYWYFWLTFVSPSWKFNQNFLRFVKFPPLAHPPPHLARSPLPLGIYSLCGENGNRSCSWNCDILAIIIDSSQRVVFFIDFLLFRSIRSLLSAVSFFGFSPLRRRKGRTLVFAPTSPVPSRSSQFPLDFRKILPYWYFQYQGIPSFPGYSLKQVKADF